MEDSDDTMTNGTDPMIIRNFTSANNSYQESSGNETDNLERQFQVMDSITWPYTTVLVLAATATIMFLLLIIIWHQRKKKHKTQDPKILCLFYPDNAQHERAVMAYANYLQEHCHFDVMRYVLHYHQQDPDRRLAKTMLKSKFLFIIWSQKAAEIINSVFSDSEGASVEDVTQPIYVLKERILNETTKGKDPEEQGIFNIYYIESFESLIPEALQHLPKFKLLRDADRILTICNLAFLASYQKVKPIVCRNLFSTTSYRISNQEEQNFPGKGLQEIPEGKEVRRAIKAARRKHGSECRKERLRNKNLTVPMQTNIALSDMDSDIGDSEFEEEDAYNFAHRLLPSTEDGSSSLISSHNPWTQKQVTYPMREMSKIPGSEGTLDNDIQRSYSPQP